MEESFYDRVSKSRLYSLGDKLGDVMLLSLCFFVTSLPIVTIGTSATALYYAINKRVEKNSATPVKDFFHSFKQNLKQGIAVTIVLLLYAGVTAFNLCFALFGFNGVHLPSLYTGVAILLILPLFFTVPFVCPYLARFKNTVRNTIFHSFTFSTMYTSHTFLMWLYILLSLALMIVFIPSILFVPFTCCYLCRRLCERDFNYAMLLKDKREHPEKYKEENTSEAEDEEEEYEEEDTEEYEEADPSDEEEDDEDDGEDADESENSDDGNDADNEPSDVDEEGFEE